MRCGIISLLQESNTFLPNRTTLADFAADVLASGEEIRPLFEGSPHELGGFFEGLSLARVDAVPLFAARALPYGMIEHAAFEQLMSRMLASFVEAGPLDGILVAPHGATVSETALDADGYWLSQIRRRVGPGMPIIGTIDPHANLSPAMIAACDGLIAYRTNPHIDQRQRGAEAAHLMVQSLRGEIRPTVAAAYPPMAICIDGQATDESPCKELYEAAEELRSLPGVLSTSILLGFPYADVPEMGSAAIVVTDDDAELAQKLSQTLAVAMWKVRQQFEGERWGVERAIRRAMKATPPVCLLDMGDNVGGGAPGDSTWLAHALISLQGRRSLVVICDAQAVEVARQGGVGSRIVERVGGRSGPLSGAPLRAEFTLSGLYDGKFSESQAVHGGFTHFDQGPTAVLTTGGGLTVVATSRRTPPFSLGQLTSCGLDPESFHFIVAKGVNAPLAAYSKVCNSFICVDTPGHTTADMASFDYQRRRRPMFPFEPDCDWSPAPFSPLARH